MVSRTQRNDIQDSRQPIAKSLGYDFALLGLGVREARVETIRRAAGETAAKIQSAAIDDPSEVDAMLADLASSTYRLLDPRRRGRTMERVQLSVYSEGDLELQGGSRRPLLSTAEPLIAAEVVDQSAAGRPASQPRRLVGPESIAPKPRCVMSSTVMNSSRCRAGRVALGLVALLATAVSVVTWLFS